ncbi:MAG: hypothetical protein LBH25_02995 [Fibromonadaceae bacterium]|jgi:hypothetical protein|nr:hypothetical protein [Fibromonadaceae bacterium]
MFLTIEETSKLIENGKLLHIAGNENLLKKLPKGNWIGGSTEYFMTDAGGKVSNEKLFVTEFSFDAFSIKTYSVSDVENISTDAYEHGFSVAIVPFDSPIHKEYSQKAAGYKDIFMKNIVGWISGVNLSVPGQTPIAVDGKSATAHNDKAVVLHIKVPDSKEITVNILNIFEQDKDTPVMTFAEDGFSAKKCFIDGKETDFADYIEKNKIDIKLPLVGDYGGHGVNISFKEIKDGVVQFYAPVFNGINYRIAKSVGNYTSEFNSKISVLNGVGTVFSCNCILNFLYGELDGKQLDFFVGPITFGEIAYQLVNQTLVYVTIK